MAMPSSPRHSARRRVDFAALALAPLGVVIVAASQLVAGVPLSALLRPEAALVVFGGTIAALLVTYAPSDLASAAREAAGTFIKSREDRDLLAKSMIGLASTAHRRGLVAVESELESV